MTKSVSKVLKTSTVVAVAATAISQVEALNDRPHHNRLRTLQEGEDASTSTSLSMPTNVESINNLIEEEKPKFQEKQEPVDLGILVGSVMSKNSELADKVSHALDQMGDWDKQELVEKVDDLLDLAKHLLGIDHSSTTSKSGKSKSGKSEEATTTAATTTAATTTASATTTQAPGTTCTYSGETIGPYSPDSVSRNGGTGTCCEDIDCYGNDRDLYCSLGTQQCYCSNFLGNGNAQNGECCDANDDCVSNNCVQTGPGADDKFCAPQ